MTTLKEQLIGVWSGNASPAQETTLVFCPGGQGLLFFSVGSSAMTPFVDEFTWSVGADMQLRVRWLSRHEFAADLDEEDAEPSLTVTQGVEESAAVEFTETPRALRAAVGMHGSVYADMWLVYVAAPVSYEAERENLRARAENTVPFGVDADRWSAIRPFFGGRGWLGLNHLRLVLSFLFFGALGQTLLWAPMVLARTGHRGWILLPLLFFPLFALFRETHFRGRRWYHVCLVVEIFLASLYALMAATGLVLAYRAGPMSGLILSTTLLGSVPCLYMLWANPRKWRQDVRADPTLAMTFRDWRGWRIHGMKVWLFLGIMTGIVGEMLFLLRLGPPWLTKWPRVLLHCVPALIAVCDEDSLISDVAQKFGAVWYFAVLILAMAEFVQGWHPVGWAYFACGMLIGIAPCVYALKKSPGHHAQPGP